MLQYALAHSFGKSCKMARITVNDCLENVENRFQLVLIAAKRARQIALGASPMVSEENDKATVLALREIAAGFVDASILSQVSAREHSTESVISAEEPGEERTEAAPLA